MEAIRKPETIGQKIEQFYARYPRDKYYYLTPPLDTATPLPEHFDLSASPVAVSPDLSRKEVYPLKYRWDNNKKCEVPDLSAGVGFNWVAINRMLQGVNVRWNFKECRRIDDGMDRDFWRQQAVADAMSLTGTRSYCATRQIDLKEIRDSIEYRLRARPPKKIGWSPNEKEWKNLTSDEREEYIQDRIQAADENERRSLSEKMETKAKARVARQILAIPTSIDYEIVKKMTFLVIGIIFAPHAKNDAERRQIIDRCFDAAMPAFNNNVRRPYEIEGGANAPMAIEPGETPRQIEGPREAIQEAEEVRDDDEDPEPADTQGASPGGEHSLPQSASSPHQPQQAEPTLPLEPPLPPGSQKPTAEKIDFLQAVGKLKAELLELLGAQQGAKEYYKLLLTFGGAQHANQIKERKDQSAFYRKLEKMVKLIKENPQAATPHKPFAEALEMARTGYEKLSLEKLTERIEAQMELQKYPTQQDPLEIVPLLQEGNKAKLVDVTLKLLERGMLQTQTDRERQQADPRGGRR